MRTFISVSRTSAAAPSFSFSLTNIFSFISSHLTSTHYQSINCPVPQYHPTIPVLLHTLQGVKSPLLLSRMFFLCHYCFVVRPVARASFELSGNNRFPFWAASPHAFAPLFMPSSHPHTFFRNFHTYKHIHTQSPLLFSPHLRLYYQQQMSNEKKNPLSHRCCVRLGLQRYTRIMHNNCRASCRHWGRACMYSALSIFSHFPR